MNFEITKKKHVLLVIRHPVGGIKTFLRYVYKYQYFGKYRFTIIVPKNNLTNRCLGTGEIIECKIVECEDKVISLLISLLITLIKDRFDLIHSHGFTSGACVALFANMFSTPHLMTSHDVIMEKQFTGKTGAIKKKIISFLFNRIDLIQSVTHDAQNNFNNMLPDITRPKQVMILNGIDISLYESDKKRDFRAELKLADNCFLIGFLGRFMSQKGFKYLVKAIESICNQGETEKMPIVLAFGNDGFIREEKEIISQKKLDKMFRFLPPVDNVAPVLNGLDVVVMPSLWEACGLLGMETLLSGIPLIASNCIGLREVIDGSPAFVVKPEDAQNLAEVIKNCMMNSEISRFQEYRAVARKRFDSKYNSIQLLELYDDLVKA